MNDIFKVSAQVWVETFYMIPCAKEVPKPRVLRCLYLILAPDVKFFFKE